MKRTKTNLDSNIRTIIESDIFDYLELDSLPDEEKAQMMENLIISLRSRIMIRIADLLEKEKPGEFETFKKMLGDEKTTAKDVDEFLKKNQINIDVIAGEESILLKTEVMGLKNIKDSGGGDGGNNK